MTKLIILRYKVNNMPTPKHLITTCVANLNEKYNYYFWL